MSSCVKNQNITLSFESQQVGLESVHNARQLGGYVIGDKKVKMDLLLRGGALAGLSSADSSILADNFRLQRIYDFRSASEITSSPDIIPGDAQHYALPIDFSQGGSQSVNLSSKEEILSFLLENAENPRIQELCYTMYDNILLEESSQEVYRKFFKDLVALDPEDGAVFWHCTQGKDRAGCASALLLAALGADRELIMADYALSNEYYAPSVAKIPCSTDAQKLVIGTMIGANPSVFAATLDKVEAKYGSIREYMTQCLGVTSEMMAKLASNYLE